MDLAVVEEQQDLLNQLTHNRDQVLVEDMVVMEQLHLLIQVHVLEQMDQLQEDGLLEEDKAHLLLHRTLGVDVVAEVGGLL
jgi:hypothetical protein